MSYTIEEKEIAAQPVAYKSGAGTAAEIPKVMSALLPEVMGYLNDKGVTPAGPPFTHYLSMGETIQLESGIPIKEKIEAGAGIKVGLLPGGTVLRTEHIGPYDTLNEAYQALARHVEANDLNAGDTIWEYYWTDPGQEPDPAKWRTEIFLSIE